MSDPEAPNWETHGRVASEEEAADIQTLFRDNPKDPKDPAWETHGGVQDEAEASDIHKEFWKGKPISVGVNGAGVVARHFVRLTHENPQFGMRVNALNYKHEKIDQIAELIQLSSIYGPWHGHRVEVEDGGLVIDKKHHIQFFAVEDPRKIPWDGIPVDIVIEATRVHNDPELAAQNLRNQKPHTVIISAPPEKNKSPVFVYGVNHDKYNPKKDHVVSAASCSSNALITAAYVLDKEFGLESLFATTTHALTGEDETYDRVTAKKSKRSPVESIVPGATGATKTLFEVLPHLEQQLAGSVAINAARVSVSVGSKFDIFARVSRAVETKDVVDAFRAAAGDGLLKDVIVCSDYKLTSVDCRGDLSAALVPIPYISVLPDGRTVSMVIFYDNIQGFNAQMARLAKYIGQKRAT